MRVAIVDENGRDIVTEVETVRIIDEYALQLDETVIVLQECRARAAFSELVRNGYLDLRPMSITELQTVFS